MDPASEHETTLSQKTLAAIRDGMAAGKLPVVPQILELIRIISSKSDSITVQQLADIIAQDPGTMTRVISIANKLAYNPAGVEIATIHQAISIIGFERIRNLSISVMLMENAESQLTAAENREVAGIALASGFMAQELLNRTGLVDPEVAFVCAALRNYGRLMLTTFLPEEYEKAKALAHELGQDEAYRKAFGLTPLEIGRELLESEQLPAVIVETMQKISPAELRQHTLSPLQQLTAASEFSVRVFELFEDPELTPESFAARAAQAASQCVPNLKLSHKKIEEHLQQVSTRCQEVALASGSRASNIPLFRRVEALVEGRPLPPPSILARRLHAKMAASVMQAATSDALQSGASAIARALEQNPGDLDAPFGILLELLQDSFRLRESIVFLLNPGAATCKACYGRGAVFAAIQGKSVISRSNRDVFGLCLQRGEDMLLQNPNDPKVRNFVPPWLLAVAKESSVMLLALRDRDGAYGVVLGILQDKDTFTLIETVRADLVSLRSTLAHLGPSIRQKS